MVGSDLILSLGPSKMVFSLFGWGPSYSSPTFHFLRTPLGTREHDNLFFRQASHACDFPEDGTWKIGGQLRIGSGPGIWTYLTHDPPRRATVA